jgi:hypothetical protein
MKRWLKRIGLGLVVLILFVLAGAGIYAKTQTSAYDESMEKVYDVPIPKGFDHSTDPVVIDRGKHLASAFAACALGDCHGPDLGGGRSISAGPLGTITAPNIGLVLTTYSDGELARLIRHGVKKDGRSVRMMPANEFNWISDSDVVAIISWVRTVRPVDKPNGLIEIKTLGKIMDRKDNLPVDIARRIDHEHIDVFTGSPEPTVAYGKLIGRGCNGCHGPTFGGGPIPGAPSSFPVPLNLTPDETGMKAWTYEDFDAFAKTGIRKNGKKVDKFMPQEALSNMDDIEKHALFAFLQSLPPVKFGSR